MGLCFILFSFFASIQNMLFHKDKVDIFREDLGKIAFYTRTFDQELSKFFTTLDIIVQSYQNGDNIFIDKEKEIDACRKYIEENQEYLKKI